MQNIDEKARRKAMNAWVDQKLDAERQRTPEERRVVAFVDEYVSTSGVNFPSPRAHVVRKTPDGWDVTLVDIESFRRGERPAVMDLTYRVLDVRGRLQVAGATVR